MSVEAGVLSLMRSTLEREIPGASIPVFFEALSAWSSRVPTTVGEVLAFVRGPLRSTLTRRYGEQRSKEIVASLERSLRPTDAPPADTSRIRQRSFADETTKTVVATSGPLIVVVLASRGTLVDRASALADATRLRVLPVRSAGELARMPPRVAIAMLDVAVLPRISPRAIVSSLATVPLVLVWGNDAPEARELMSAFERESVRTMGFSHSEPADPMLDVLRARLPEPM